MTNPIKTISYKEIIDIVCAARDEPMTSEQEAELKKHLATGSYCQIAARQFDQLFRQMGVLFVNDR